MWNAKTISNLKFCLKLTSVYVHINAYMLAQVRLLCWVKTKKAHSAHPKLIFEVLYNRFIIWQRTPNSVKTRNREVPIHLFTLPLSDRLTNQADYILRTNNDSTHNRMLFLSLWSLSLPLMAIAAASSLPLGNHSHMILRYMLLRADAFEMILVVTELRMCGIPISICLFLKIPILIFCKISMPNAEKVPTLNG